VFRSTNIDISVQSTVNMLFLNDWLYLRAICLGLFDLYVILSDLVLVLLSSSEYIFINLLNVIKIIQYSDNYLKFQSRLFVPGDSIQE
jgi:hypothetical protein